MTSAIFSEAASKWSQMRREFDAVVDTHYLAAEAATNGHMLNRLGHEKNIDPFALLTGPRARALKYASEELVSFWAQHPRPDLARFELDWISLQRGY